MNNRQEYNRKIVKIISDLIERNPDMRFCQLLAAAGLPYHNESDKDLFYEESSVTYNHMLPYLESEESERKARMILEAQNEEYEYGHNVPPFCDED